MQHTSASFELDGDAQQGEMKLYGPFGGLALVQQWEPGKAVLIEGDRKRTVPSLGVPMIFDWLYGKPIQSDDWWIEPRGSQSRYLHAVRLQPLPRIELIIAVKKATP